MDSLASSSAGIERRHGERRTGVGRRIRRDRRMDDRRVDSLPVEVDRRSQPDRRVSERRENQRRTLPDRRTLPTLAAFR